MIIPDGDDSYKCSVLNTIQIGRDDLSGLLAADDGDDFKRRPKATPLQDPLLEEAQIVTCHQLKTATKVRLDPTVDVGQPLRDHAPAVAHLFVNSIEKLLQLWRLEEITVEQVIGHLLQHQAALEAQGQVLQKQVQRWQQTSQPLL